MGLFVNYEVATLSSVSVLQQDIEGVTRESVNADIYVMNIELVLRFLFNNEDFMSEFIKYLTFLECQMEVVSNIMQNFGKTKLKI
jgi:hypothetical protein